MNYKELLCDGFEGIFTIVSVAIASFGAELVIRGLFEESNDFAMFGARFTALLGIVAIWFCQRFVLLGLRNDINKLRAENDPIFAHLNNDRNQQKLVAAILYKLTPKQLAKFVIARDKRFRKKFMNNLRHKDNL